MLYNDINLIPVKRSGTASAKLVIGFLIVFTVLSYIGIYFVYEPLNQRAEKQRRLDELNAVISGYGNIATEYIETKERYNEYIEKTNSIRKIADKEYSTMDEMETLVYKSPAGLKILSINLNEKGINLTCFADNYETIAKYIKELNSVEYFKDVKYSTINYSEDEAGNAGYSFVLTITVKETQ